MGVDQDLLLLLTSAELGEGEPDLGEALLKAFLTQLLEHGTVPARIICINSGIFLTTEGSPVLDLIRELESRGSEVLSCSTCLDYHRRKDRLRVGSPTNMRETVVAMLSFKRVLKP